MASTIDQHIISKGFLIISSFFIFSSMTHAKKENIDMRNNCLLIQNESIYWPAHVGKKNKNLLFLPVSSQKKEVFDCMIQEMKCLSNSMLFIHLNIDNGVNEFHYYTWDNSISVYHMTFNDKNNYVQNNIKFDIEILKKDMKIFDEIINLSNKQDILIDIDMEDRRLKGGSQIYLIVKNSKGIKRFGTYKKPSSAKLDAFYFATYFKSILEKQ